MSITKFPAAFAAAILVAPCALPPGGAIAHAFGTSLFDPSALPPLRTARFSNS